MPDVNSAMVSVPVTLDRPRTIRLTNRALMRAEIRLSEVYKEPANITERIHAIYARARITHEVVFPTIMLVVLLHQGLLHEDPTLTEDQVADMTDFQSTPEVTLALMLALTRQTMPPAEASTNGASSNGGAAAASANPPPAESTGSPTGLSVDTTSALEMTSSGR